MVPEQDVIRPQRCSSKLSTGMLSSYASGSFAASALASLRIWHNIILTLSAASAAAVQAGAVINLESASLAPLAYLGCLGQALRAPAKELANICK